MLGFVQHDMSKLPSLSRRFCKGSYSDNHDWWRLSAFLEVNSVKVNKSLEVLLPQSCNFGAYSCCKLTVLGAAWFRAWNRRHCWMQELMVKSLEGVLSCILFAKLPLCPLLQTTRFLEYPFIKRNWEWNWFWFCPLSSLLELPQWQCPRPEENLTTGSDIVNTLHNDHRLHQILYLHFSEKICGCLAEEKTHGHVINLMLLFTDQMMVQEGLQL
jgi:hypothetical protein